ncbi:MAG TPA: hypothetical protein VJM33_18620 [Microthrixaceae bacterium]|nr:hypothetical protein [Microthrixaceae bacterium]
MTAPSRPTPDASPGATDPDGSGPRRRITVARVLAVMVCLGFALMWAFVFSSQNRYDPAGWLADRTFPVAAEPICREARNAIDELPAAREARDPIERAATIDVATDHLATMQADLRAVVPETADARWIGQWVDDWSIYIQDRYDYVEALSGGDDAEFLVSEKYGTQLSKSLDNFAQVNRMPSCKVPGDV